MKNWHWDFSIVIFCSKWSSSFACQLIITALITNIYLITRSLGYVRSHIMFWPRSSSFFTWLSTKWGRDLKSYCTAQHTIKWIKTIYVRGPTRTVINVTTRKDSDKNQIITNINYDQNSLSLFWKQLNTKSKWHQIKPKKRKRPGIS